MRSLPRIDARYWQALVAASVFGTNTGDFVSDYLHIGHLAGLPVLALVLAGILAADRFTRRSSLLYFWAAIITVRTAATNVGDAFHDFGISLYASVPLMLLVFAGAVLGYRQHVRRVASVSSDSMRVDAAYWGCMMLAGVLGTVGGDFVSFRLHLTAPGAAALFAVLIVIAIRVFQRRSTLLDPGPYWTTVALIRVGGTAGGDALAHLMGLAVSTAVTGAVFVGLVVFSYAVASRRAEAGATPHSSTLPSSIRE